MTPNVEEQNRVSPLSQRRSEAEDHAMIRAPPVGQENQRSLSAGFLHSQEPALERVLSRRDADLLEGKPQVRNRPLHWLERGSHKTSCETVEGVESEGERRDDAGSEERAQAARS